MAANASGILRTYYTLAGLYTLAASVIWGVNTLFLLDAGLSISQVFMANAAYSLGTVLFEIPTGVIADTLGRRFSFLLSIAVLSVTTIFYLGLWANGGSLLAFAIVSVFMGLGFTFYSGAMEAWVVDALNTVDYQGELDRVFARGQMVTGVAMLIGTVGGGLLGQISLGLPYIVRAGLLVGLLFIALVGMREIGFTPRRVGFRQIPTEAGRVARAGITFGWGDRRLRLLMLAGAVQTGFLMWAFYAWQPYFLDLLERDAVWVVGVVSALISLSMIGGNAIVEWLTRFCGRRTTLMLWSAFFLGAGGIAAGVANQFLFALIALLAATTAMGVGMPVRQSYFHHVIPTKQRATVVSFDSMISGVGGVGGQVGLGRLAESRGYSAGYIVGGAIALLALPLVWGVRRIGGGPDYIVGKKAGVSATCAAHGIPAIAGVESQAPEALV